MNNTVKKCLLLFRYNKEVFDDLLLENQLDMEFYSYAKWVAATRLSLPFDERTTSKWSVAKRNDVTLPSFCPVSPDTKGAIKADSYKQNKKEYLNSARFQQNQRRYGNRESFNF